MSSSAELHLCYRFGNATIRGYPFPHCYVEDAFPREYYEEMQRMLPDPGSMHPIRDVRPVAGGYPERFVLPFAEDLMAKLPEPKRSFWIDLRAWLIGGRFASLALNKFAPLVQQRFRDEPNVRFFDDAMLVQDVTNYSLGPHSDTPKKVITMLFYLPRDMSQSHLGTSIYVPKDPGFRDPGGPHHPREDFDRLWTAPFLPNSLFVFFKTDNSFHGVEPVTDRDCRRWLLLYDIYKAENQ